MTWTTLAASGKVKRHRTSSQELADLRAVVERDLEDAAIPELSADRRFATAYNAALQLCKLAIAISGYRIAPVAGHHQTTLEAAVLALGPSCKPFADYFDLCRRKRNFIDYDHAEVATETEAKELVEKAAEFERFVEAWILKHHPKYRI